MNEKLLGLTADIVSAYVSHNRLPVSGLGSLLQEVNASLSKLERPLEPQAPPQTPAVNPKRSVHADHIVCLEDGLKFKSLKRHLKTSHGLTPAQYRERWGLAADYPIVAVRRQIIWRSLGLGLAEYRPRLWVDVMRRACGAASADAGWFVV